jgi:hypothetical protein
MAKKIGFIVEGDVDKQVIAALVARIVPTVEFKVVRLGGKAALTTAHTTAALFLHRGYSRVFIVFDTDTTDKAEIETQRAAVESSLREHDLLADCTIVPIAPSIHVWMSSKFLDGDRPSRVSELVQRISVGKLETGNASFAEFARLLRNVAQSRRGSARKTA